MEAVRQVGRWAEHGTSRFSPGLEAPLGVRNRDRSLQGTLQATGEERVLPSSIY